MTNKENILHRLETESKTIDGIEVIGITANDIAALLNLKRNIVSQYLNELNREGKVVKINTRPVYFIHKKVYDENKESFKLANDFIDVSKEIKISESDDVFSELVGYDGSLQVVVEQCKAATNYPTNGLPILLIGDSGVGKSYIAQLIYNYAKKQEIVSEESKFIIFNCAEYANNPELLSAALFGAIKGAYTGADSDKKGLIEEADGGYLFLDEIHRLSSEGQEKLFIFLDKGVFRRVGESGKWRKANVRVIFATTENPEKFFLKTFLRRIPLVTKIPSFNDRPTLEKLELIKNIYRKEALVIDKDIILEENVMGILVSTNWSGNVGKIINTIKITCANAFSECSKVKDPKLRIGVSSIPKEIIAKSNFELVLKENYIIISRYETSENKREVQYEFVNKISTEFIDKSNSFIDNKLSEELYWEEIRLLGNEMNKSIEEDKFNYYKDGTVELIRKIITNKLNIFKDMYGIKAQNGIIDVITNAICVLSVSKEDNNKSLKNIIKFIQEHYKKLYILAEEIVNDIETTINIKVNSISLAYIAGCLVGVNKDLELNVINAIIIAHGKYTASSIASVANNMLGMYIYDSIDMPIDVSTKEIARELREYIKNIDSHKGLILLVDMGSLQEIYLGIKDEFNGDIAIINNLSTLLALDVGDKIMNKKPIQEIIKEAASKNVSKYNYIPATNKKKDAIITTCSTGIGTAEKIKNLLEQSLKDKDISILAYDYDKLKEGGENEYIFNEYKIRLIIGLSNPNINNIPYLSLEDIIMGNDSSVLLNVLSNIVDKGTLENVNNILLKEFTITNVINNLVILNPDKLLTQVQDAISNLEFNLKAKFPNTLKIGIYIHAACMIERLVIRQPINEYKNIKEFAYCNRHFINHTKNAFSVIENFYKIDIPISEIAYIYDTISRKINI